MEKVKKVFDNLISKYNEQKETKEKVRHLDKFGYTRFEIAKETGLTVPQVNKILK